MNKQEFTRLVNNPSMLQKQHIDEMEKLLKAFPYCQSAQILHLIGLKKTDSILYNQFLKTTAASVLDRNKLSLLINQYGVEISSSKEEKPEMKTASPNEEIKAVKLEEKKIVESDLKEKKVEEKVDEVKTTENNTKEKIAVEAKVEKSDDLKIDVSEKKKTISEVLKENKKDGESNEDKKAFLENYLAELKKKKEKKVSDKTEIKTPARNKSIADEILGKYNSKKKEEDTKNTNSETSTVKAKKEKLPNVEESKKDKVEKKESEIITNKKEKEEKSEKKNLNEKEKTEEKALQKNLTNPKNLTIEKKETTEKEENQKKSLTKKEEKKTDDVELKKENNEKLTALKASTFSSWLKKEVSKTETTTSKRLDADKEKILENFIKNQPSIERKKKFYNPVDMAKQSVIDDPQFVSETLAKIYEEQSNYEKAIKTYRTLSLKYPKKNTYFAKKIEELEKLINP